MSEETEEDSFGVKSKKQVLAKPDLLNRCSPSTYSRIRLAGQQRELSPRPLLDRRQLGKDHIGGIHKFGVFHPQALHVGVVDTGCFVYPLGELIQVIA